jgi:hypothetical protein
MFERYTEHARRSIFFARYEASLFGSPFIETEHLLLGLLREDQALRARWSDEVRKKIRSQIEDRAPRRERSISTSVDLPISHDLKRGLSYAAEESSALEHTVIDCGHLLLGLLRIENSVAATVLGQNGIDYETYRDQVVKPGVRPRGVREEPFQAEPMEPPTNADEPEPKEAAAPSLAVPIATLHLLVAATAEHLDAYSNKDAIHRLKRKPWSRKEALGHLIDWATAHQQWIAVALSEPRLVATAYPGGEWVTAQKYNDYPWKDLVRLWVSINCLLIHVLEQIPEEKVNTSCRVGIAEPISLATLIERYVEHCEDIVGQILTAGKG